VSGDPGAATQRAFMDESTPSHGIPRVRWTIRDMVVASVAAVAFVFVAAVVVVAAFMWLGGMDPYDLASSGPVSAILALEAVLVIPVWIWGPGKYRSGWRSLGFRGLSWLRGVALCGLALAVVLIVEALWETIRQRLGWPGQPEVLPFFGGGPQGLLLALFLGAVVAPIAEEVYFRGFIYAGLRERLGLGWAVVLSAALFALAHLVPSVVVPIFVMGLVFALLYEWTGSLWPCVALHTAVNALAFLAAYVAELRPELFTGI